MEINVSDVIVEERARQGYGFLDSLERSIQQLGVMQPIGITQNNQLIFGGRRLQACKNLGMETIPARVFDIDTDNPIALLQMERDENDQRLPLTPSEKVEIARRIEESLAGRRGQRTDLEHVSEITQVGHGKKTREIAAEAVDMKPSTYYQAKTVVDSGNRDVIEQMDSGEKSISAAYESVKPRQSRTFKITLYKNPTDDAEVIMSKGGKDYCTKLGLALLKAAGHTVEGGN